MISPLVPRPPGSPAPLAPAQRPLWLLDRFHPGTAAYSIARVLCFEGPLVPLRLATALTWVVERHESLRTAFEEEDGWPIPVVGTGLGGALPWVDLSRLGDLEVDLHAGELARAEAARAFDLSRGPLLRRTALRLTQPGAQRPRHQLLLVVHHIVFDGWSLAVLLQELCAFYVAGTCRALVPLAVQYGDFAVWEEARLASAGARTHQAWWQAQLEGLTPTSLPADRLPERDDLGGARRALRLPAAVARALAALSRATETTTFMILLAVFRAFLARLSDEAEWSVATPVANRPRSDLQSLIGLFSDSVVLRLGRSRATSFLQLLAETRSLVVAALAHPGVPSTLLADRLAARDPTLRGGLFRLMFAMQSDALAGLALPGLDLSLVEIETGGAALDACFELGETGTGWCLRVGYRSALFDATTAERWLRLYSRLLAAALGEPARAPEALSASSPAERAQLCQEWNDNPRGDLPARLDEALAAAVERFPDAVAVVGAVEHVSYAELWQAAGWVAAGLAGLGVGPEGVVGLSLARGCELISVLLGTLRAGAAYLPLDPAWPLERRLSILAEAAAVVVAAPEERAALADGSRPVVAPSQLAELGRRLPPAQPLRDPRALAYLIYTSGSTGRPKGVMVAHSSVAAYAATAARAYRLRPGERVLQLASLAFDASAEEIFPTLVAGATLVLRDEAMLSSPGEFFHRVSEQRITVLDLPTAWWHECAAALAAGEVELPSCLRLAILGGERALPERAAAWCRAAPVDTVNTYGPTEATIVATVWWLARDGRFPAAFPSVPIGRPVAGATTYVVDSRLRLAPLAAPGELALAGRGLARGYLARPGSTAERFVPGPFSGAAGCRLYLTGDRVRQRADGVLEFLGRTDRQVKVRGFRIELAEIELALARAPGVGQVAVLPWGDPAAAVADRLVAYLSPAGGAELPPPAGLRRWLESRLPAPMLPAAFIVLPTLPRTTSGKLDLRALPAPGSGTAEMPFQAPETAVEKLAARLWAEVLGVPRVGLDGHFFELGGHSLTATQVAARFVREIDVAVPLATFFAAPRLADFAAAVEELLLATEPIVERGQGTSPADREPSP